MAIYRLKIVGIHYAVNPDSASSAEETALMHQRTADQLRELDDKRPAVVLMHEPQNPADDRAVMARVMGRRIGYVDKTQLDIVHALLESNGRRPLRATIDEVNACRHGWLFVTIETSEEVPMEHRQRSEEVWREWESTLPVIAPDEAYFAREEAEVMLDEVFATHPTSEGMSPATIEHIETYMNLWIHNALHDLSNEARLTREHYIKCLKEMMSQDTASSQEGESSDATPSSRPLTRIKALVTELMKQRTAICGQRRSTLRVTGWWRELMQSAEMQRLWNTWTGRIGDDLEQGMREITTLLRALPCELYAYIDEPKVFLSRMHYSGVPRDKYWQVVSLMLLRQRTQLATQHEGVNDTVTPPEMTTDEPFLVTIPKELQTPEAKRILTKLQKRGLLDEDLQPVGLSGAKRGVLAWELCDHLGIKTCWKTMGTLWRCNGETIRKAREKGFMTDAVNEFTKKLKVLIR